MINILKLIKLHFSVSMHENIEKMLNEDLFLTPEYLAIHIYRMQNRIIDLNGEENSKELLLALSYIQRIYTQMEIYYSAKIGKNLTIFHGVGTVIGARVEIGDNVTIYQNVTIGDKNDGRPGIGDNVKIFAGAKVLGDIHIGEGSVIGANSVVINSFKKGSVIAGVPARIIKTLGAAN